MEVSVSAPSFRSFSFRFPDGSVVGDLLTRFAQQQDFYVVRNGRRSDLQDPLQHGSVYHLEPRLRGGKGGFGSMLRALGAQIEKTTNREACRDLSGRRLRDVNHEKEMAEWLQQQAEREAEKEQRRLERLQRKLSEPKHQFNDPEYQQQCHDLAERLEDSVLKGLQASSSSQVRTDDVSAAKRPNQDQSEQPATKKKKKTEKTTGFWTGVGDLEELLSSEDEDEDEDSPSTSSSSRGAAAVATTTHRQEAEPESSDSSSPESGSSSENQRHPEPCRDQRPPESCNDQRPPESCNDQKPPESCSDQRPPESCSDQRPPESCSDQRPPESCSDQKPPEACRDQRPPESCRDQKPPEACRDQRPPEACRDQKPPEACRDQKPPEPCRDQRPLESCRPSGSQQVDLSSVSSVQQLEFLGLDVLKEELMSRGLKCGGTLSERAARLFSVRGLSPDQIDPALLAKAAKSRRK